MIPLFVGVESPFKTTKTHNTEYPFENNWHFDIVPPELHMIFFIILRAISKIIEIHTKTSDKSTRRVEFIKST